MEAIFVRHMVSTGPAEVLIASIWQGLLLTAFAWTCLKLVPGLRASVRFTVWLIAFLLVALLPCFAILSSLSHVAPAVATPARLSLQMNPAWALAIEAVWLLASVYSLARLIRGALQMRSLYRGSAAIPSELDLPVDVEFDRQVEIRLSDAVDAPSVIGFFRPAIVLPRSLWSELSPTERKQIILHEMAHLDRGDDWTNLAQKLLRSLSPLNPALVWAERQLCREREQACDDAVLDAAGNARDYATCLTRLAGSRLVKRAAGLAPGLWKRPSELAVRVDNILHRRRTMSPLGSRALIAASLLLSLSGALALQRCPGLITFTGGQATTTATVQPESVSPVRPVTAVAPARYDRATQPRYQDAVFHPPSLPTRVAPIRAHSNRRRISISNRHFLLRDPRFVRMSEEFPRGETMTLILFTVGVPRSMDTPALSITNNWIAFQI